MAVPRHDAICAYIIAIIMTMTCHVTSSLLLLSPMQSETMEDDNISRLALPRQDVVKPLLDVLDRHVLILPPSNLCLDLNIFLMMLFRSIFWETNPPGSFWLLRTSEDGTTVPILNETPVMLNFFLKHQFVPIFI